MDKIKLKNNDGSINYLAFSKDAEEWAKEIHNEGGRNSNKISQLRKFYDELFKLSRRAQECEEDEWKNIILPNLHMLIPKVVYAKARKLVTDKFVKFIKGLIEEIKSKEDLKLAVDFFEAFIGFYRVYGNK